MNIPLAKSPCWVQNQFVCIFRLQLWTL
jgi:hypothetical protein